MEKGTKDRFDYAQLVDYLKENGKKPADYVLSKLKKHDFVLLGEMHRVKQQLELYHNVIPLLPSLGATAFATEFVRRVDQPLVDRLLANTFFDKELAIEIMIRQEAFWGFEEYLDIFRIIWETNNNNPANKKISLIALNDPINWKLYNSICNNEKREPNEAELNKIWNGCSELLWLDPISEHYEKTGGKVLAIMGSHHAFTQYKEPSWEAQEGKVVFTGFKIKRFGNYLLEKFQDKVFSICFHDPWVDKYESTKLVQPANGVIEKVISPHYSEIGFDLNNSPWGELPDYSVYSLGYEDFKLKHFFDGYLYTGKLTTLKGVTAIPNFINTKNEQIFRESVPFNYSITKTIAEINTGIKEDADVIYRDIKGFE